MCANPRSTHARLCFPPPLVPCPLSPTAAHPEEDPQCFAVTALRDALALPVITKASWGPLAPGTKAQDALQFFMDGVQGADPEAVLALRSAVQGVWAGAAKVRRRATVLVGKGRVWA
jgi:hypothetical protein